MSLHSGFIDSRVDRLEAMAAANIYKSRFPASAFQVMLEPSGEYVILVEDPADAVPEHLHEFDEEIRPITARVRLDSQCALNSIPIDVDWPADVAATISALRPMQEVEDALLTQYHHLGIRRVTQDPATLVLTIWLDEKKHDQDLSPIHPALIAAGIEPRSVVVQFEEPPTSEEPISAPAGFKDFAHVIAARRRSAEIRSLPHLAGDEQWLEMFQSAAAGELNSDGIYKTDRARRPILIPSLAFQALPDIRTYFLTYDQVVLEVPRARDYEAYKAQHGITDDILAAAAAGGLLRLLITHPEEDLPLSLLRAVGERSRESIIGRHAGAAFAMATLARRERDFSKTLGDQRPLVRPLTRQLATKLDVDPKALERLFLEPVATYHQALDRLNGADIKGLIPSFGLDAWAVTKAALKGRGVPDLDLEFLTAAHQMRVADLFGSELAVSDSQKFLHFPCHTLHVLQASTQNDVLLGLAGEESHLPFFINPSTPIYEFSETRPIDELIKAMKPGDSIIAKSILSDLAALPADEREARVLQINDLVREFGAQPSSRIIGDGMAPRYAVILANLLGLFVEPLGTLLSVTQVLDGGSGWFRDAMRFKIFGSNVARTRRQIEMLRRVRGVAWLSEKRQAKSRAA